MKITAIKQQVKQADRYSIFVDDEYAFSLSENALLASGLASGQELTKQQVKEYVKLSAEDKLFNRALKYVAMRPRSIWEMRTYLERKGAAPETTGQIVDKLIELELLDDYKFTLAFVRDRALLKPTSRRKLAAELAKKHISSGTVEAVLAEAHPSDEAALRWHINKARRQSKYAKNQQKLMAYLARQGFNYSDIKQIINEVTD